MGVTIKQSVLKASRAGCSGPQRWAVNSAREKVRQRHPAGNTEPMPSEDKRQDLTGNKRGLRWTEHKARPTNGKGSRPSTKQDPGGRQASVTGSCREGSQFTNQNESI